MRAGRWRTFAIATAVATIALLATRQVGSGHSPHANYRAQVHALLDGHLALGSAPDGLAHDLAWTEHGVQQVWGLGVPAWQTPFELAGRAVGWTPFPDRVALLAWLALALFAAMRAFVGPTRWIAIGSVLLLAGLPAFVTLLRGRLGVYEEAAAYAYGAAVMLVAGLVAFAHAPRARTYLVLVGLAGLAGFIRPTVWFYGLATFVVATALWIASDRARWRVAALGAALFVAGGGLLYATNARRFGDGMEFGHRLNLHSLPGNVVATRFSYPFEREPLLDAAAELGGSLFDRPELASARKGFYQAGLHLGQQGTPRWREYYFTTYHWAYLPLLALGALAGLAAWRRGKQPSPARWLGAWCGLALIPMVAFYLWSPSLSSRYQLDLGPAFAGLLVIAWQAVATRVRRTHIALAVLLVAWLAAIATSKPSSTRAPRTVDRATASLAVQRIVSPVTFERQLPDGYTLADAPIYTDVLRWFERCSDETGASIDCHMAPSIGDVHLGGSRDDLGWYVLESIVEGDAPMLACPVEPELEATVCGGTGIGAHARPIAARNEPPALYLNGVGWNLETGRAPPATHFFVESPRFVEIDVVHDPSTADFSELVSSHFGPPPLDWTTSVRVAIGLHHLQLVAGQSTDQGARLRFVSHQPLRPGLQVVFVAFGSDLFLDRPESDFLLRAIRWR